MEKETLWVGLWAFIFVLLLTWGYRALTGQSLTI